MKARNWRYDKDGQTFRYGRLIIEPSAKPWRPNDLKVYVAPDADSEDRTGWILLEMPELAALVVFAAWAQRKDFTEEQRIQLDLIDFIVECVEKPNWRAIALYLDLYAAQWASFLDDESI